MLSVRLFLHIKSRVSNNLNLSLYNYVIFYVFNVLIRNAHSSISCHTVKVEYDYTYSDQNKGYGGTEGRGAPGCPTSFFAIGTACINLPIQSAAPFDQMKDICRNTFGLNSAPYSPTSHVQNAIFRGYINHRNNVILYINLLFFCYLY